MTQDLLSQKKNDITNMLSFYPEAQPQFENILAEEQGCNQVWFSEK